MVVLAGDSSKAGNMRLSKTFYLIKKSHKQNQRCSIILLRCFSFH